MKKILISAAFLGLSACASANNAVNSDASSSNLQAATATYFATPKGNVPIGSMKQSVLGTAYQARVGKVLYGCNYFRGAVSCNRTG